MALAEFNFAHTKGDTLQIEFTRKNGDGSLVDLSNFTSAKMNLRKGSTVALALTTANSRISLSQAASGVITVTVAAADMELAVDIYQYDLVLISTAQVLTLVGGKVRILERITPT